MKVKPEPKWDPISTPSFWINQASRLLMRRFEEHLRPIGFGMAYLPVVMALEEFGVLQQKELALKSHVEQPTMAALLTRMERDGLITRTPHPHDKRSAQIALSARAKGKVAEARRRLGEVVDELLHGFSENEKSTLIALLQRGVTNLGGLGEL